MIIEWKTAEISEWQADALIFPTFEKPHPNLPGLERWMAGEGSWLEAPLDRDDFQGKFQQISVHYGPAELKIRRVVLVGLGPADKLDLDKLRKAVAVAFRKCRDLRLSCPAIPLSAFEGLPLEIGPCFEEALIGGLSGLYRYQGLKTRNDEPPDSMKTLLVLTEKEPEEAFRARTAYVEAVVSGITLARDLVSAPPNLATPGFLAKTARQLADQHGFQLEIMDLDKAEKVGLQAFAAVARGSREPACFIVMEYVPGSGCREKPLVFVGKGITFDTGGISLKPGKDMDAMKHDMAGAAAVLGLFEMVGRTMPDRGVVGILPCTENMPGGMAYKPSDVIRTFSGFTVEVISTDAEGRMVLCDALTYAERYRPALVVDIATLTGACTVALGKHVAAIMGNRDTLIRKTQEIGMEVGEKLWPLPLWDFYFDYIKSDVADFRNVGERAAGTIVGGIFLKQFVPESIPWIHLDIAGTAWTTTDWLTAPKGATGFGVRLLAEVLRRWPELEETL